MAQNPKFFVQIPVKPYVKRYLEINFGNPINFSSVPEHERYFLKLLRKKSKRSDTMYSSDMVKFDEIVEIIISRDDFMRHGFELSKTNIIKFGKYFEDIIKLTARNYIQFKRGLNSFKDSILEYQNLFDLTEDFWSYESLKKEIDRNGAQVEMDFRKELNEMMDRVFLENLKNSKLKLISENGFKHYLERV